MDDRESIERSNSSHSQARVSNSSSVHTRASSIGQSGDDGSKIFPHMESSSLENTFNSEQTNEKDAKPENMLRKRKAIFIHDEEAKETLKKLTPLYRRRIFLEQLRSNWYWIVSFIVAIIGISVTISLFALPQSQQFVSTPPIILPIHGSWGIVSINGIMIFDIINEIEMNNTDMAATIESTISFTYSQAGITIETLELLGFNTTFPLDNKNEKITPTNKETVMLNHVARLPSSFSAGVTESEMMRVIHFLRKAMLENGTIVFDPNLLMIRRGSTVVWANSIDSFLNNDFPSLDLSLISARIGSSVYPSSCKALPKLTRGVITPNDCHSQRAIQTGLACVTECVEGAILSGSQTRVCLSSGVWSGWPTFCEIPCSSLKAPTHGIVSPSVCRNSAGERVLIGGQACNFYCEPGYQLFGSLRVVCKSDGQWSSTMPICKKTCSGLSPPENGHVVPKLCYNPWVLEESFCTFYCNEGYTIHGEVTISCLGNGKWTDSAPYCSKSCPKLVETFHGRAHPSVCWKQSIEAGTSCSVECEDGYQLLGSYQRTCKSDGQWSGTKQACVHKCPKIRQQTKLITSRECAEYESIPGSKCTFSCEDGYKISGASEILCLRDGVWDNSIPSCVPDCARIPEPTVGDLECSGTSLGSDCTLYCPDKHEVIGKRSVTCNEIGLWSDMLGYCVNTCKKYQTPKHAKMIPVECDLESSTSGQVCQIECDDGYSLTGPSKVTCDDYGDWTNNDTVCIGQDQYLIEITSFSGKMCLKMNSVTSSVYKESWNECDPEKYSKWTFSSSNVIRSTDGVSCLAAESAQSMSLVNVKRCDLLDPLQLWEGHPHKNHIFKLKDHNLYIWEGYVSYPRILLNSNDDAIQTTWKLYDVTHHTVTSLYGVTRGGQCPALSASPNGRWSPSTCSTVGTKSGSYCTYICENGFSFAGSIAEIQCKNGFWSRTIPIDCILMKRVMLVQQSPPSASICVYVDADKEVKARPYVECENTTSHLWEWADDINLRNIATGKCLKAEYNETETFLALGSCDSHDNDQNWKCSPFLNRFILTLSNDTFIPVYNASNSSDIVNLYRHSVMEFSINDLFSSFANLQWYKVSADGTESVVCSDDAPILCHKIISGNTVMVTPALCKLDNVPVNTSCIFQCPSGYITKGDTAPAVCDESGYWTKEAPDCVASCRALSIGDIVIATPGHCQTATMFDEGEICRFYCPSGYSVHGDPSVICLKNGNWSSVTPTCRKNCIPLQTPLYGEVHPAECTDTKTSILEGAVCRIRCNRDDNVLIGSENRTCADNGTWTGEKTICAKPCHKLYVPPNTIVSPASCLSENSLPGTVCQILCEAGYLPREAHTKTCLQMGIWVGSSPDCQKYCPPLTNYTTNDIIFPLSCIREPVSPGFICGVKCNNDYNVMGEVSIQCSSTGSWNGYLGSCKKKCPVLEKPLHGMIHPMSCFGQDNFAGTICTLSCQNNFVPTGPTLTICKENGDWDALNMKCSPGCPPIGEIKSGTVEPKSCRYSVQSLRSFCEIHCNQGTMTSSWSRITKFSCMSSGFWDQPVPTKCLRTCRIPILENGHVLCEGDARDGAVLPFEKCAIKCDKYHTHTSDPIITCIDGRWSPPVLACEYDPYPLIIVHRVDLIAKCLGLDGNSVVMQGWGICSKDDAGTRWAWRGQSRIINSVTGLCLSVTAAEIDSPVIVSQCDDQDMLQEWDCGAKEPYHLHLRGSDLGPSLRYGDSNALSLQKAIGTESFFYSFNPTSENGLGTVCSLRLLGGCQGLALSNGVQLSSTECTNSTVRPGTVCELSCLDNEKIVVGPNTLECQDSGLWRPGGVSLCEFPCPPLFPPPGNATYNRHCMESHGRFGDTCNYICPDNYVLISDYNGRTCRSNGVWSEIGNVACERLCPELKSPINGIITPQPCISGTCSIECDVNFRVEGPKMRSCTDAGLWTDHDFLCVPDSQFPISTKINLLKVRMCLTVNDGRHVVKARCETGSKSQLWKWKSHFALENVASERCLAMRASQNARVTEYSIGRSEEGIGDTLIDSEMESDVHVTSCDVTDPAQRWGCETRNPHQPFRFILSEKGLYLDSGPQFTGRVLLFESPTYGSQWAVADYEGITTICSRRTGGICSPIKPSPRIAVQPQSCYSHFITAGMTCYFQCDGQYVVEGLASAVCKSDGFWTNSPPSCLGINMCAALHVERPILVHPSVCSGRKVRVGRRCRFKCPGTHVLVGNDTISCDSSRKWSGDVPLCKPYCPSLSPPKGGTLWPESCQNTENDVGKICHFNCSDGYDIVGYDTVTCEARGWSGSKPTCRRLCPTLQVPENSTVKPDSCVDGKSSAGALCTMSCSVGYTVIGNATTSCLAGEWSNDIGVCSSGLCPRIESSVGGVETISYTGLSNDAITTGSTLLFGCQDGHVQISEATRICGSDGLWIGGAQLCAPVACEPLPGLYKGRVSPSNCQTGDNLFPGTSCTFSCVDGYALDGPSLVECLESGQWSKDGRPFCYNEEVSPSERLVLIFAIKPDEQPDIAYKLGRILEGDNQRCLVAPNAELQSPIIHDCSPISVWRMWRWYGSSRVQSLSTELCWDLDESRTLIMKQCDLEAKTQEVGCGSTASENSYFDLKLGGEFLSHSLISGNNVSSGDRMWAAVEVGDMIGGVSNPLVSITRYGSTVCNFMCGGQLTFESGDFSTPNFPNTYPPDVLCEWTIDLPQKAVTVDITPVRLSNRYVGDESRFAKDKLVVFQGTKGDEMTTNKMKTIYSSRNYSRLQSYRGIFHIEMHSDHTYSDNQEGFAVRWFSHDLPDSVQSCGVSGQAPSATGYPWQVLVVTWKLVCDAALISPRFVITTAHCVAHVEIGNAADEIIAAYGFTSRTDFVAKMKRGLLDKADRIWVYDKFDKDTLHSDIAILRLLHGPLPSSDHSLPICLPDPVVGKIDHAGDVCVLASFQRNLISDVSQSVGYATSASAVLLSERRCEIMLRYERGLPYDRVTSLCAEVDRDDIIASEGEENDGGAVLQCVWNGNWYAVGLAGYALSDVKDGAFWVFTRVSGGQDWIRNTLEKGFYSPSQLIQ